MTNILTALLAMVCGPALAADILIDRDHPMIFVWKDKAAMTKGIPVYAKHIRSGEPIPEAWAKTVTNCVIPSGTLAMADVEPDMETDGLLSRITITAGPDAGCHGVVLTPSISPKGE